MDNERQKIQESACGLSGKGKAQATKCAGQKLSTAPHEDATKEEDVLSKVLERGNLRLAIKRVKENKGAPGVDGMTVDELSPTSRKTGRVSKRSF